MLDCNNISKGDLVNMSICKLFLIPLVIVLIFSSHTTVFSAQQQANTVLKGQVYKWQGDEFTAAKDALTATEASALKARFEKHFSNDLVGVYLEQNISLIAIKPLEGGNPHVVLYDEASNKYKAVPHVSIDSNGFYKFPMTSRAPISLVISDGPLKKADAAAPSSLAPQNSSPTELPGDFDFKINYGVGGVNCIDTFNNTFTKDLIQPDRSKPSTATTELVIPTDQMLAIYGKFLEYKIADLPDDINADAAATPSEEDMLFEPSQEYTLFYICNGVRRKIVYDESKGWPVSADPDKRDRLMNFVEFITKYIYATKEYAAMPPTVAGYI
jgi:hypothetical protein